jgi:hypothetical protein
MRKWRSGLHIPTRPAKGIEVLGYAQVNPLDHTHVKIAIDLFGGVLTGLSLPRTAEQQSYWRVVTTSGLGLPGSWGGHCTLVPDYTSSKLTNITWGEKLDMSWAFLGTYCDELWAVITREGMSRAQEYQGVDERVLVADLGLL